MKLSPRASLLPLAFAGLLSLGLYYGQNVPPDVEVRVHPVGGAVSYLSGWGGNVGLSVGADGVLMIDSQYLSLAPKIESAVRELAGSLPVYLVNTHWHGDHTGGNPHFAPAATILAHENVRRRLAGDEAIGGSVASEVEPRGLPAITFQKGLTLHFNGEEVRILHFPGAHTDGDAVVWFPRSKVAHLGDLYFQLGYPYIDVDSGGSVLGLIDSLHQLLEFLPEDARLIPGHGELSGMDGLREYLAMIEAVTERVRAGLKEGKSAAELSAAGLTQDFDERWGGFAFVPPARFVQILARSLSGG